MDNTTTEIQAILDELTAICCRAMQKDGQFDRDRVHALVKSLSINGWKQHNDTGGPLATILERRVRESCQEPAMHRGAELRSLVDQIGSAYDQVSRYEASAPSAGNSGTSEASTQRHPTVG